MAFLTGLAVNLCTALVAVLVFLVVFLFRIFQNPSQLPPGPRGLPIIGCLPNLAYYVYRAKCKASEPFVLFDHLAKDFGNIFSMHLATKCVVVVNNYDSVREAFRNRLLNDRPQVHFLPESTAGVILACGDSWSLQRRFTLSTFRDFGIGKSKFQEQISTEVQQVISELDKFQSSPVDPHEILSIAVSNVICSVVLGKRFDYADTQFQELLRLLDEQAETSSSTGLLYFMPPFFANFFPALKRKTVQVSDSIINFVGKHVDNHRETFDSDNMKDYIDVFLNEINENGSTKDEMNETKLTTDNLRHSVAHLFFAGSETTVTTLRWCLLYMIAYPDIQSRIQRELDAVVGRNALPKVGDNLPITEATMMEVQRIASIAPLGVPHLAAADTTLCGYFIPKGAIILPNLWAIHHNPDSWDEPEKFNPDRFLDSNGDVSHRKELVPFSIGRRACLGENLAKMELFVFFTHLLHRFKFTLPNGSPSITFEGTLGATNAPLPFEVIATKR